MSRKGVWGLSLEKAKMQTQTRRITIKLILRDTISILT
jgi:hypothetical protein